MQTYQASTFLAGAAGPIVMLTLFTTTEQCSVLEFSVNTRAITTTGNAIFGVPASNGTGSAGVSLQPLNPVDPASTTKYLTGAWATTQPTAPTNPLNQFPIPVSGIGHGIIWGWELGELIIPVGGQLVFWVVTGQVNCGFIMKVAEGG